MQSDPWLGKWMPSILEHAGGGPVLELGCGPGWDTADLAAAGCRVIACDLSAENLVKCRRAVPEAGLVRLDLARPLPFPSRSLPVILASLCLHYFPWEVTLGIASELRRCIRGGGLLLARFNSVNDRHRGAVSPEEIEPNFFRMKNGTKRFFDEGSVRRLLEGWRIQYLEEKVIHRYRLPKYVWEAAGAFGAESGC